MVRRTQARAAVAVTCGVIALTLGFPLLHAQVHAATARVTGQKLAIPAYFTPGGDWTRMVAAGGAVSLVVVNVNSGPGTQRVPAVATAVQQAQAAGQQVVGYVDTNYAARATADVLADIAAYRTWYGVNGVFLDRVPTDCGSVPYYRAIWAARAGGVVVLNPGTNTSECYLEVGDVVINFEGTDSVYESWQPSAWVSRYPATRFWHLVYGISVTNQSRVVELSKRRNAGYVYVTTDALPNPWDRIPPASEWASLLASVQTNTVVDLTTLPSSGQLIGSFGGVAVPVTTPSNPSPGSAIDTAPAVGLSPFGGSALSPVSGITGGSGNGSATDVGATPVSAGSSFGGFGSGAGVVSQSPPPFAPVGGGVTGGFSGFGILGGGTPGAVVPTPGGEPLAMQPVVGSGFAVGGGTAGTGAAGVGFGVGAIGVAPLTASASQLFNQTPVTVIGQGLFGSVTQLFS